MPARCFGSNAAASWGYHYNDLIEEPKPREVVTIFELDSSGEPFAKALYNYLWTPQTDPDGVVHARIDYPGVVVDHASSSTVKTSWPTCADSGAAAFRHHGSGTLRGGFCQFSSAGYTGGNIDDWRIGKGDGCIILWR